MVMTESKTLPSRKFDLDPFSLSIEQLTEEFEKILNAIDQALWQNNLSTYKFFDSDFWVEWNALVIEAKGFRRYEPNKGSDFLDCSTHALLRYCTHVKLQNCLIDYTDRLIEKMKSLKGKSYVLTEDNN